MARTVREPIQVYLTTEEREVLDRCAAELGVSRSEVLRRGLRVIGDSPAGPRPPTGGELLTPAKSGPGAPPPSLSVAPLSELLEELSRDRDER